MTVTRYFAVDSSGEAEEHVVIPFGPRMVDAYRFTYLAMALAGTLEYFLPQRSLFEWRGRQAR